MVPVPLSAVRSSDAYGGASLNAWTWLCRLTIGGQLIMVAVSLMLTLLFAFSTKAQSPPNEPAKLSSVQLQTLVSRVALYPDDLLAIVLPASTQPLQVVEAQRLLEQRRSNPKVGPPKSWDPSVVALLNYPDVLKVMNDDLDWTQQLGEAVVRQQSEVMDAIQGFRQKAYAAGNLVSNDKQTVTKQKESIVVHSADPTVIYVPTYNPATVVYVTPPTAPPPYYWSPPYPYYYDPAAAFFTGAVFGTALGFALSWDNHDIYHGDVNINRNVNINTQNVRARIDGISQNRENRWHSANTELGRQAHVNRMGGAGRAAAPLNAEQVRRGLANATPERRAFSQRPQGAAGLDRAPASLANRGIAGAGEHFNPGGHNAFSNIEHGSLAEHQSLRGLQSLGGAGGFQGAGGFGGFHGGGFHGGGFHGGFHRR
ncbi:uncharacterized protein DUF3300 [Azospirillum brasilense]|uniref:DUF3300 domain-containing protein n=1 Tax=Azospirillum baldaniorum TaxID=1064539 RepID=UPI000D659874|nr:DUF3300 domain-containing protein [Azospirillum baldaniorum]TWA68817.1 uncharacterized protein DUF3300 [Azospirillum brasilense]